MKTLSGRCLTLLTTGLLAFCLNLGAHSAQGSTPLIVNNSNSPHAKLKSLPVDSVQWTDGFWKERFEQNAAVTLRRLWLLADDPEIGHVLDNFRIAAGEKQGERQGTHWQDAWLYKWLEAAAVTWRIAEDPWIAERIEESIRLVEKAQQDDGYLATQTTLPGWGRFQDEQHHEAYTMGHLITAGVIHQRMTGDDTLFKVAKRTADYLCSVLGKSVSPSFAHNPSAIMGLTELYRDTGEQKYLDCAALIVSSRGKNPKPMVAGFARAPGHFGSDIIQDRTPLRKETEPVGHNVFFTYLYTGATDVFHEIGDQSLNRALRRIWDDLTQTKICINGGVSPMGLGVSKNKDFVNEAVGPAYFIPSASAYNETCGQIGNLMWNYRMLCTQGEGRFADMVEHEIYNGILSGVQLDGTKWWYRNVLRNYQREGDRSQRFEPGRRAICCPTNLLRTVAEFQSFIYSLSERTLWVHHYAGNRLQTDIPAAGPVVLRQETDYPWSGRITLHVDKTPDAEFCIRLRVPGWAETARISVNGEPSSISAKPGAYAELGRVWRDGDRIELDIPMPVRMMEAHPKVEQLRNQAAIMRGPILYCLESVDLPDEGMDLFNVFVREGSSFTVSDASGFPFGIKTIQGSGWYRANTPWTTDLYREIKPISSKKFPLTLIPYFAWANRGSADMSVWLPVR